MLIYSTLFHLRTRLRVIEPISFEESERRALLQKEWSRYKGQQRREDNKIIADQLKAQEKALRELRLVSEELYSAAIEVDPNLVPFKAIGPVVTPPIDKYVSPAEYPCQQNSHIQNHFMLICPFSCHFFFQ